jgi:hypothetical protein
MSEILSAAAQSIVEHPIYHVSNVTVSGATAMVGTKAAAVSVFMGWVAPVAAVLGLCVSCAMFYERYQRIKLNNIELAKKGRRESD